jgi:hypothetical protein
MGGKHSSKACGHTNSYQAIRPPQCAGGIGCDACRAKWNALHAGDFEITVDEQTPAAKTKEDFAALVAAAKRPRATVETVCNVLRLSPSMLYEMVERA